jgi:hypothetical protein
VEETCRFIGNKSRSDGAQLNGYKGRLRQTVGKIKKKYLDANRVAVNIIYDTTLWPRFIQVSDVT